MNDGETLTNAAIGALATVLPTLFVPPSPLVGGALSGYLSGCHRGRWLGRPLPAQRDYPVTGWRRDTDS